MKQIILIDREFGAGGSTIGEKVAARLKWKLFDQALSEEIAKLARAPVHICRKHEEHRDPFLHRLVNIIWRGSFIPNPSASEEAILNTDSLVGLVEKVVLQAAEQKPCVIVGRGAPYFLRDREDTFSVFLYASRTLKYHRVLKRVGGNEKEAVDLVDSMDDDRRKFVKHYFGHEWPKRELFNAMLNTGMGDDNTADTILRLLEDANRHEGVKKA